MTERLDWVSAWTKILQVEDIEWSITPEFAVLVLILISWIVLSWLRPASISVQVSPAPINIWHPLWEKFQSQQAGSKVAKPNKILEKMVALLGVFSLLLALANPHLIEKKKVPSQTFDQVQLAFVIESSVSFLLTDYELDHQQSSRMDVVKRVLSAFLSELTVEGTQASSKVSVTIYADEAYQYLPMTDDLSVVQKQLARLRPYLAGRNDAAMGEGLGLGLKSMHALDQGESYLILISDGMTLSSRIPLEKVVEYALTKNLKIISIGVGAASEAADKRQFSGLIYQPLESDSLRFLASATGGQYLEMRSAKDLLTILNQFKGQKVQGEPTIEQRIERLYMAPLSLAGLLFILWFVLKMMAKERSVD